MKHSGSTWIERALFKLLKGRRGDVRAYRDAMALEGTVRVALLFGATVIMPAVLLAVLSLSSITAEELAIDADIHNRAGITASQIEYNLENDLNRFEDTVKRRLRHGDSLANNIGEMSPFLRVVLEADAQGMLLAPFTDISQTRKVKPSVHFLELFNHATKMYQRSNYTDAAAAFSEAHKIARHPNLAGEAALGRAKALIALKSDREADLALVDVYADYAHMRTREGFIIGQLASLTRGEQKLQTSPDVGADVLKSVVESALSNPWELRQPGDSAIAWRALEAAQQVTDPEWLSSTRNRLLEKSRQMFWAERLVTEFHLLANTDVEIEEGDFYYTVRAGSSTMWSVTSHEGRRIYFALDYDGVVDTVREDMRASNEANPDLAAQFAGAEHDKIPLARSSLSPWLSNVVVNIYSKNPEQLVARKRSARYLRMTVLTVAILMTVLGAFLSARLIATETESARMKTDFAANVSHELRSPITKIRLRAEALQYELLTTEEEKTESYNSIVRESERLSRLVDNVLDFASIERGAKKYTFRPEDLGEVIYRAVDSCGEAVGESGVKVDIEVPNDMPVAWIDREAISQVMVNLLSNAIKYGDSGGWVGVKVQDRPDSIRIEISDHGDGIPESDLPHIFWHFYRSPDTKVRSKRGTGIGLAIVRYIVQEHGGTISVESTVGLGTTFQINLPKTKTNRTG